MKYCDTILKSGVKHHNLPTYPKFWLDDNIYLCVIRLELQYMKCYMR